MSTLRELSYSYPGQTARTDTIEDPAAKLAIEGVIKDLAQLVTRIASTFNLDMRIADPIAGPFYAKPTTQPSMSVVISSGGFMVGSTLVFQLNPQTVGPFTPPVSNPRIDRIVLSRVTGVPSVLGGTEAASPLPPPFPTSIIPICRVLLTPATTSLTASQLIDERVPWLF